MKFWPILFCALVGFGCATNGESELYLATQADPVLLATGCDAGLPGDSLSLGAAALDGDLLRASASFAGGCAEHQFAVCWQGGAFLELEPVRAQLEVHHDAQGDSCESLVTQDIFVDLSALKQAYRDSYQKSSGTIDVTIADSQLSASYSF